uniref:Uncharacterized protein n=1 Tax=viral metagenome TaxID=1070528 RepID=A0A6C0DWM2_9ZZZZ
MAEGPLSTVLVIVIMKLPLTLVDNVELVVLFKDILKTVPS